MQVPAFLQGLLEPWLLFLAEDPSLRLLQMGMLFIGIIVIFLVFYTTRDILLRTNSFWYMFVSIIFVAFIPVIGFFLYLLLRPARTLRERELEKMLTDVYKDHQRVKKEKRAAKSTSKK